MNTINQENYYKKIKELNILHYSGEIPYYIEAPLRAVEIKLLIKLKPSARILDVGCGSGRFSVGAALKGFNTVGIDITPKAIKAAEQKAFQLGLNNVQFMVGDMTTLPFKNESFEYVFCPRFSINAVATFSQRQKAVEEMLRVVKNGGVVFIESFNKFYLGKGIIFLLKNIIRDIWRHISMFYFLLRNKRYPGLLPGDIIYESNKIIGAPQGYAHLPTVFELWKLIPENEKFKFYSIRQIVKIKKIDLLKFFRYSIWIFITKSYS